MFSVKDTIVGSGHGGVPQKITLKNQIFHTNFKKILVVWKSKIQQIDLGKFGDGMELLTIASNPFMMQEIRGEFISYALQLYTEYDERTDSTIAYAYQFPKDHELIEEINKILPSGTHLYHHEKFVLVSSDTELKDPASLLNHLKHNGKRGVLSFLYGLSLIYGTWAGEGVSMEIRFPFRGSVVQYQGAIEWIYTRLQQQSYDIECKITHSELGQWQTIQIHDWTLLEQFAAWQGVEGPLPGRERAKRYHTKLLEYLKMEHTPGDTMKIITNGLLKLWKK